MTGASTRRVPPLAAGAGSRLVMLEPNHQGHRMSYCASLVSYARRHGVPVTVATGTEALASDELALHLGRFGDGVDLVDIGDVPEPRGARYEFRVLETVADLQRRFPDARIVVLEGDKFAATASFAPRRGVDWSRVCVLVMRAPRPVPPTRSLPLEMAKSVGMAVLSARGATVKVLVPATPRRRSYRFGPWSAVPDPVDVDHDDDSLPAEMDAVRGECGRQWIGVFGHITRRKNLDLILDAARARGARDTGVVIAGLVAPEEAARCRGAVGRLREEGGRVVVIDRLLSDSELDGCIAAVDVAVLAHSAEGPSGIFGKAVALGTPVVSAGAVSLRRETARLAAGVWVPLTSEAIARALSACAGSRSEPRPMADSDDFAHALLGP